VFSYIYHKKYHYLSAEVLLSATSTYCFDFKLFY
jgi:hypothetical protein